MCTTVATGTAGVAGTTVSVVADAHRRFTTGACVAVAAAPSP